MEQREHPRIDLPLMVEVTHAAIGKREATARDLSDGGVYINMDNHGLHVGASIKLRMKSVALNQSEHAPEISAQIVRADKDGFAAQFKNKTAEHLWSSVERLRQQLLVGRDYFQVYEAYVIANPEHGVLLVQQHGRWQFPGQYLEISPDIPAQRIKSIERLLGLQVQDTSEILDVRIMTHAALPEAATYCTALRFTTNQRKTELDKRYRHSRWVTTTLDLNELTFAQTWVREVAQRTLGFLRAEKKSD